MWILAVVSCLAVACKSDVQRDNYKACWREAVGTCETWRHPPAGARAECQAAEGQWTSACLTLDAVANCVIGGGIQQIFYSRSKFTEEQARLDCTARAHAGIHGEGQPVFEFSSGNQPDIHGR